MSGFTRGFFGIILIVFGIRGLIAYFKRKKSVYLGSGDNEIKKVLGKVYHNLANIIVGIICIFFGTVIIPDLI